MTMLGSRMLALKKERETAKVNDGANQSKTVGERTQHSCEEGQKHR